MAKNAAVCILFMMVMAFAVEQAESTIILKSLILGALLKKLFHHKKVEYVPVPAPKPVIPKPVIPKPTGRPVFHKPAPGEYVPVPKGRRLMRAAA